MKFRSSLRLGKMHLPLLVAATMMSSFAESAEPTKKITIDNFTYRGAFALPAEDNGLSSLNFAKGTMQVNGRSLFIAGFRGQPWIAQYAIPRLKVTKNIRKLRYASPIQPFVKITDRAATGNPEKLDRVMGMEKVGSKLYVNLMEYYDAPADNNLTTLVVKDASNLATSQVSALHRMKGAARAAGWLSPVPLEWRKALGARYISGNSSGPPIIRRLSVGPSAFAVNFPRRLVNTAEYAIRTKELQGFSLTNRLHDDLSNDSRTNDLWTHLSAAQYGFIVPGTSTYVTIGSSGGHNSGVSYKKRYSDGFECPGYCANKRSDVYNYYWLWDLADWKRVKSGAMKPHQVRPYEYGKFDVPFQTGDYLNPIGGASYDAKTGLLYISVLEGNNTLGEYSNPPVVAVYKIE